MARSVGKMQALCKEVELEVDCTGLSPSASADRVIRAGKALPLRRMLAGKAHMRAAHTKVLYGGFMGCGWRRWSDEVGLERLLAVIRAWEEHDTVYAAGWSYCKREVCRMRVRVA